jgi:hypothetical protein
MQDVTTTRALALILDPHALSCRSHYFVGAVSERHLRSEAAIQRPPIHFREPLLFLVPVYWMGKGKPGEVSG